MKTIARSLLASLLLAGCGASPVDDAQAKALADLDAQTGTTWTVRYHADVHTPAFLDGRTAPLIAKKSDAKRAALAFFADHAALFRMRSPVDELVAVAVDEDELGMVHARFQQQVDGVAVAGAELTAHFAPDGALVRVHGRYLPLPAIDVHPATTVDDATRAALAAAQAARPTADPESMAAGDPSLVVDAGRLPYDADQPPRLAWLVEVQVDYAAAPARLGVFVDARTGQAYRSDDLLDAMAGTGEGVLGDRQPLEIVARGNRYALTDEQAGSQRTYSAAAGDPLPGKQVTSDRPDRWDEAGTSRGAAVDAHAFATAAFRYFARVHGRNGWNGLGSGMRATVHYGQAFAGALWNGAQMVFGDGDGKTFLPLAGAVDVVAHEYTHGVNEAAARLGHDGERGALNEAIADLFGCFVERSLRGAEANWSVGEAVVRGGMRALRDLADPHRTGNPAHVSERVTTADDRGGIHVNSTIVSHAAFLLTIGGTNRVSQVSVVGLGVAAAEKVWYRALTRYLGPTSGFRDAADATLAAARDLYGAGAQAQSVEAAWRAVGVLPE